MVEYIDSGATGVIPLHAKDGSVKGYTLVDAADIPIVNRWRWTLSRDGYAMRSAARTSLHRFLLGLAVGDPREGDHIDRDTLNNRRANLRIVTDALQAQNRGTHRGASSRFRGVGWHKRIGKWAASLRVDGRRRHLGYFDDETVAAQVASAARLRLMPGAVD